MLIECTKSPSCALPAKKVWLGLGVTHSDSLFNSVKAYDDIVKSHMRQLRVLMMAHQPFRYIGTNRPERRPQRHQPARKMMERALLLKNPVNARTDLNIIIDDLLCERSTVAAALLLVPPMCTIRARCAIIRESSISLITAPLDTNIQFKITLACVHCA